MKSIASGIIRSAFVYLALLMSHEAHATTSASYLMTWTPYNGAAPECAHKADQIIAERCYDSDYGSSHSFLTPQGWIYNSGQHDFTEDWKNSSGAVISSISVIPDNCPLPGGGTPGYQLGHNFSPNYDFWCMIQGTTAPTPPSCPAGQVQDTSTGLCYTLPERNAGPPCLCQKVGDPIDAGSGNKYEEATDYTGGGPFPLVFKRSYNSSIANESGDTGSTDQSLGAGWSSGLGSHLTFYFQPPQYFICYYDPTGVNTPYICPANPTSVPGTVTLWHGDGSQEIFSGTYSAGGAMISTFTQQAGSKGTLTYSGDTYSYLRTDGYTETYNSAGKLTAVKDPHGLQQSYTYSTTTISGTLYDVTTIADPNGRQLVIYTTDSTGLVWKVTTPALDAATGTADIVYGYTSGNLTTVTYPDSSVVTYEYSDSAFPHAMTGLKDERGNEYAAWSYDSSTGQAICSEHAPSGNTTSTATTCLYDTGGTDKVTVSYGTGTAAVTEATGLVRNMTFTSVNGKSVLSSVDARCRDCGDLSHSITYDGNGQLDTVTDFNGNVTDYTLDAQGLEQTRTEASTDATYKRTIVTTWYTPSGGSEMGMPKTITHKNASGTAVLTTTWCYNFNGTSCVDTSSIGSTWTRTDTDPASYTVGGNSVTVPVRTTTYGYSGGRLTVINGPLTSVTDTTTYAYYTCLSPPCSGYNAGDLHTITDAVSHATTITQYSAAGFPMSLYDPNNVVKTYTYDKRGRLLTSTLDASGTPATTTYTYYPDGTLHTKVLPITASGHAYEAYTYDHAHRLTNITNDAGEQKTFTYTYNTTANTFDVEEQRFPNGSSTAVYDHHLTRDDSTNDRLLDTDGNGHTTTSQYDANGNVISVTDPLSHVTHGFYDALNRVEQTEDAKSNYTSYTVDSLDHTTDITPPRGSSLNTHYIPDAFGDVMEVDSPDTGTTTYGYDAAGNLTSKLTARGKSFTYTYDGLYRILSEVTGVQTDAYAYDNTSSGYYGIGRLDSITEGSNSTSYKYDSHGNVRTKIQSVGGQSFTVSYQHDGANNLTQTAYPPASGTIHYDLDVLGRINDVNTTWGSNPAVYIATNVTYMPFGPLSGLTYMTSTDSHRLVETRSYDLAYRLTGIDTKNASGSHVVQYWTYGYNNDNTISGITDNLTSGNSQTFGYDSMGRITSATGAYGSITVGTSPTTAYDPDGNRTQITVNGTTTTYSYNYGSANNDILASTYTGGVTTSYGYNADGNTTTDGTYTYINSAHDQVDTVKLGTTTQFTAAFNAYGQRWSKTVGTSVTYFVYDEAGHMLAELNSDGSIQKQHIWMGDRPLAYYSTNINGSTSADVKYLHVDQLNTPRAMTDSTSATSWTWNSDPWGTTAISSGSYRPRFPGQWFDSQTGNMQNWMRDYDPQTGRYLQSDPIGLRGGINTYTYGFNNPISKYDFTGLLPGENVVNAIDRFLKRGARCEKPPSDPFCSDKEKAFNNQKDVILTSVASNAITPAQYNQIAAAFNLELEIIKQRCPLIDVEPLPIPLIYGLPSPATPSNPNAPPPG